MKDHLGNVRTIVTNENRVDGYVYLATYEPARAVLEGSLFDKVAELRDSKPGSTDPDDQKIALLDGSDPAKRIGTSLLLKVMAGDKFDLSMEAAYLSSENSNNSEHVPTQEMVSALAGALSGSTTVLTGGESGSGNTDLINNLFNNGNFVIGYDALKDQQTDPSQPRVYLNYLFFDQELNLVPAQSGVIQVTQAGNGSWSVLASGGPIVMPGNGYFNVFASTENYDKVVLIDNLKVTYSRGTLLEEQHYYPHGLVVRPVILVQS